MTRTILGVIGGSGIYDLPGLENTREEQVASPWGAPSDALRFGRLHGLDMVFLPRHGRGHVLSPTDINYRANIDAMKRVGVTGIISLSAVGSFREDLSPGTFVFVDQFIDRTFDRKKSFFGEGCVAHVSMAFPVCPTLVDHLAAAAETETIAFRRGGTYLAMEGPQFSSLAESNLYRAWGCDVIGMTNMPEAKLAREAEIPYATVAMVTDYDCWHHEHGEVDIPNIIRILGENSEKAARLLSQVAKNFPAEHPACPAGADTALQYAILTRPEFRDPALVAKLDAIAGRVL